MFFALMIIDGKQSTNHLIRNHLFSSGFFKNNQAQVEEYLTALTPLLRRTTTEGTYPDASIRLRCLSVMKKN